MFIVGLRSILVSGYPERQLFMAGEGNGDVIYYVLGLLGDTIITHG
jgi:hypothetical protein